MYETGQAGQTHTIWEQLIDTIDKLYEPYFAWLFIMQATHLSAATADSRRRDKRDKKDSRERSAERKSRK